MLVLFGCTETSLIGEDFVDDEEFNISMVDSLTLNFSTTRHDSLVTSNTDRLIVGSFNHSKLGLITAESYFLFGPSDFRAPSDLDEGNYRFDSITLRITHDGYKYYDSEEYVNFEVFQLLEDLEEEDDGYLYNTSQFALNKSNPLGSKRFKADVSSSDVIEITLDEAFGEEFYQMAYDGHEALNSDLEFKQYFHGFSLQANGESPFYGFYSDSVYIRMYYTNLNASPIKQQWYDLGLDADIAYYTHITESGTNFSDVDGLEENLSSKETSNTGLIMGGAGFATRLEIPYIRNLLLDGSDYLISYAELRLYPVNFEEYDNTGLPENITVYIVDDNNENIDDLSANATLHLDLELNRDTYYVIDVTSLVDYFLTPLTKTSDYGMLLSIGSDDLRQTVTAVQIGDNSFNSRLILYTIQSL